MDCDDQLIGVQSVVHRHSGGTILADRGCYFGDTPSKVHLLRTAIPVTPRFLSDKRIALFQGDMKVLRRIVKKR